MSQVRERRTGGSRNSRTLEAAQDQSGESRSKVQTERNSKRGGELEPQYHNLAQIDMNAWKKATEGRQLRVLIAGLGGVGKSTLINQLLCLTKDGERAKEGRGGATTVAVSKHERTTKQGMKVVIFDTPGFGDVDIDDEDIIAMMKRETEENLDVVFYCISLGGSCRVQREDVAVFKIMTQVFSANIWKKAVIVLTFVNDLEEKVANKMEYQTTITQIQEKVRQVLKKDPLISEELIAQLPIVTAGYSDPILKYEAEECKSMGGWDNCLFQKALKQIDAAVVPTLFEARYNWKALVAKSAATSVIGTGIGIAGAINPGVASKLRSVTGTKVSNMDMLILILIQRFYDWIAGL